MNDSSPRALVAAPRGHRSHVRAAVLHVVGLSVGVAGLAMVAASLVDLADGGPDVVALAAPGVLLAVAGTLTWRTTSVADALPNRTVFAAVAAAWVVMCFVAAVPYLTTGALEQFDAALFEGVSGVTTTGATVLENVEGESAGLLFWRAATQWLGGLGVIVLAVAVLPFLGAGGLALLRSELPGPTSDHVAARVRDAARRLWGVYVAFTAIVAAAYLAGGMSPYDAATHAFATVSTGGFSTRTGNFAAFDSATLEWIAVAAMALAGTSLVLLWRVARGLPGSLLRSAEARAYGAILLGAALAVTAWNVAGESFDHETVRRSVFSVVSVGSTTGFTTADWGTWVQPVQAVLLGLMAVGGMTGSTAGGSKVLRLATAASYARREVERHVHPRMIGVVRVGRTPVSEEIVSRILGFHALFLAVMVAGAIAVATFEVDLITSLSVSVSSLGNVGPGLGAIAPGGGFAALDVGARAVAMALMLLGRMEIYPLLLGAAALLDEGRDGLHGMRRRRRVRAHASPVRPETQARTS